MRCPSARRAPASRARVRVRLGLGLGLELGLGLGLVDLQPRQVAVPACAQPDIGHPRPEGLRWRDKW